MQSMPERWADIDDYEDCYQVSDLGRVRSLDRIVQHADRKMHVRGRILVTSPDRDGYLQVNLWRDGQGRNHKVHRLVLTAFVGPAPASHVACHNDGDPANNCLPNLRWDTCSENSFDVVRHGRSAQANRSACPRGHRLVEPNLVEFFRRKGHRTCRACHQARSWCRRHGGDVQAEADRRYAELVHGTAQHARMNELLDELVGR